MTCPIIKYEVVPSGVALTKTTRAKVDRISGEILKPAIVKWDSADGIQSKVTTQLRKTNSYFKRIASSPLQGNIAKLTAVFSRFYNSLGGYPAFRKASNFKSFQYKPNQCKFDINPAKRTKHRYSRVYLPGIGWMRYFDSRSLTGVETRTVTIKRKADGWYMSVLVNVPDELPPQLPIEDVKSARGLDVGINKLASFSDGSFAQNKRFAKQSARRLRIREKRMSRKRKGSSNKAKTGKAVARIHHEVANKRNDYNWKVAHQAHAHVDAVVREDLNLKRMKKRCKTKRCKDIGRFLPNGQSAKRGLNRAITDASWGDLFAKIDWVGSKLGHPVIAVNPAYTSQECRKLGTKNL